MLAPRKVRSSHQLSTEQSFLLAATVTQLDARIVAKEEADAIRHQLHRDALASLQRSISTSMYVPLPVGRRVRWEPPAADASIRRDAFWRELS